VSLQPPESQDIIIVGATGDLSRRKLLPALYNLEAAGLLPPQGDIIGLARSPLGHEAFKKLAQESIQQFSRSGFEPHIWKRLAPRVTFVRLDEEGFAHLSECRSQQRRLVYLAIPPSAVPATIASLQAVDFVDGTSLIVEKPFGRDLASARDLSETIHDVFAESRVFRIDHYLGKETVQNILVFRFGNSVFERVWNRDAIDHMQITVAESIGAEGRGAFYEEVGAVRDMVQNHVLQLLSLLTMEPPTNLEPESIRDEKTKVLRATLPLDPARTMRGQYTTSTVAGETVPGYREETGVAPVSMTETFFAARAEIDTWRWAGVPFYMRTGKRLRQHTTEVSITFKDVPLCFFQGTGLEEIPPNHLVLRIQPNEGISFCFQSKVPGPEIRIQEVSMDFSYHGTFMTQPAEAYERLLHDAMHGDQTLFTREDSIERAWTILQPVLEDPEPLCFYPAGTWGPHEADDLIAPRVWHLR
jgi:glucose-6-phosphate 1-dehydrogenase